MHSRSGSVLSVRRPYSLRFPAHLMAALPICLAYVPIAFAFGVSAQSLGFPFMATVAMSVFVYAGASQMIALGLVAAGQPLSLILLTTFLVNLRMLLLGTAIAERLGHWPTFHKVLFGIQHTDETFASLSSKAGSAPFPVKRTLDFQTVVHISWVFGTVLGYQLSGTVLNLKALGLDFALAGMLIGLTGLMVRTRIQVIVGLFSASIALVSVLIGHGTWGVLFAAIGGPSLGYWLERVWQKQIRF